MHFSIDRTVHTTAFDKPVVDHWLERKIAKGIDTKIEVYTETDKIQRERERY